MIKEIFMSLMAIHIVCDFYFQSQTMADNKKEKLSWVLRHSLIYAGGSAALILFILPGVPLEYTVYFVVGHTLIDTGKYFVCKYINKYINMKHFPLLSQEQNIFITDQMLHILIILIIAYLTGSVEADTFYNVSYMKILKAFGISSMALVSWVIKILLIHKPANIFISSILFRYKPSAKETKEVADKNIGRSIGTLERIVMVILISINQYSAVGLVLTAKSIARYDRISKEQEFAEYYLLGTLLSTIWAIVVSLLF